MIEAYEIREAAPTLISLGIIEILLSVDNLLEVSKLAEHLNPKQRSIALKVGVAGAYVGRIIALLVAAPILSMFLWMRVLGALYLIYLMTSHFAGKRTEKEEEEVSHWSLGRTIAGIAMLDLSLSLDNVMAAVSLSQEVWVVCSSVVFGILFIRILGRPTVKFVKRFPVLAHTVYILVGWVGVLLLVEALSHWFKLPVLDPEQKLMGLLAILGLSLVYDLVKPVQSAVDPLLKGIGLPVTRTLHAVLSPLFWPLRALGGLIFRR